VGLLGLEEGAPLAVAGKEGSPSPWLWLWSFKPYLALAAGCARRFLCGLRAEGDEAVVVVVLLSFGRSGNSQIGKCLIAGGDNVGGRCVGLY